MSIAVFGNQHEGKELIAYGTGVLRQEDRWVRVEDLPDTVDRAGAAGSTMRITAPGPIERIVATWYRVGDDTTTQDDTLVKIETMKARLLGGPQRAVAIHLSVEGSDPRPIGRFLVALGPIARVADNAAGMR
jgi:EpsI family protein